MVKTKKQVETRALGYFMVAEKQHSDGWYVETKKGNVLGLIAWNDRWKQYVFRPLDRTEFSHDCLAPLAEFLNHLTAGR